MHNKSYYLWKKIRTISIEVDTSVGKECQTIEKLKKIDIIKTNNLKPYFVYILWICFNLYSLTYNF